MAGVFSVESMVAGAGWSAGTTLGMGGSIGLDILKSAAPFAGLYDSYDMAATACGW